MDALKITSSSYIQNMIENMILTSYLSKSYFVAISVDAFWDYFNEIRSLTTHETICDKLQNSGPRIRAQVVAATCCAKYMRNNLKETVRK